MAPLAVETEHYIDCRGNFFLEEAKIKILENFYKDITLAELLKCLEAGVDPGVRDDKKTRLPCT